MRLNPVQWAENSYLWVESHIELLIKNKGQIFQILGTLLVFSIAAGSIQYIPFFIKWMHISDMAFGTTVVYSLPFWIGFAIFLIWRS
jgi:hypothetical protein